MKKALICLEQLGIGGVETFTITQAEEFTRRNIKCYVLARDGLLSQNLKKLKNVEFIEFDFKLENKIDKEKVEWLTNFVKEKKIDFIYVHQFPCVPYILPVVFQTRIPYVAYLHSIVPKTCEWFMEHYDIYRVLFPIYFECASKIIAIADKVKEEHIKLFHLPKEKYMVINNSLDFSKYPNKKITSVNYPYNKLLWFGRVSEIKRASIETAIKFYEYCKKQYNQNIILTIAGDGEILNELKEKYNDKNIIFKGAVADIISEIQKADILLGVDRCILEAIASKKPAIICGYNRNTALITPKNIQEATKYNFTGINLNDDKDELFKYNEKELLDIINKNYDYVEKRLGIANSIYLDIERFNGMSDLASVFNGLNYYADRVENLELENKKLYLKTQELYEEINKLNRYLRKSVIGRIIRKLDKTEGEK